MRIANAEHLGRRKVVASDGSRGWLDVSAALETLDRSGKAVNCIQDLLDSGRFDEASSGAANIPACSGPVRLRAPFARPGQIIALARNYSAHAKESTLPIPHEPIFFSKSNTSVIGPEDAVVLPPNLGRVEPEIELAVVIGKEASHVPAARA